MNEKVNNFFDSLQKDLENELHQAEQKRQSELIELKKIIAEEVEKNFQKSKSELIPALKKELEAEIKKFYLWLFGVAFFLLAIIVGVAFYLQSLIKK